MGPRRPVRRTWGTLLDGGTGLRFALPGPDGPPECRPRSPGLRSLPQHEGRDCQRGQGPGPRSAPRKAASQAGAHSSGSGSEGWSVACASHAPQPQGAVSIWPRPRAPCHTTCAELLASVSDSHSFSGGHLPCAPATPLVSLTPPWAIAVRPVLQAFWSESRSRSQSALNAARLSSQKRNAALQPSRARRARAGQVFPPGIPAPDLGGAQGTRSAGHALPHSSGPGACWLSGSRGVHCLDLGR